MARLVSWLLNVVYLAVLLVCAPWILWAAWRTGKYREGYREKFFGLVPRREDDGTCVWIHAVSVGEVNLLATTIRELTQAHPEWQIVVSTTSKAGYDLARKKYADYSVFYCPLDFSWAVRRAVRRVRPALLVLAELELWPNLVMAANDEGARVAIINGRLGDKSFPRYRRIRPLMARVLRQLDLIAAQNAETAERFKALGAAAARVHVTGSLKYDGAQTDRDNPRTVSLRQLAEIANDDIVFLAGSTQEPEEQIAVEIYRKLAAEHSRLRLILVPRHPERFEDVATMLDRSGVARQRRSELDCKMQNANCKMEIEENREPMGRVVDGGNDANNGNEPFEPSPSPSLKGRGIIDRHPVLLVDTVGELGAWWGMAAIAFVGGSFGSRGGQNMIEPAAYGAAVSFGPNTWNFRDIVAALVTADGAVVVKDAGELEAFVRRCLEEPAYAAALGERAQALVQSQLGATRRTVALLERLIPAGADESNANRAAA